MAASRRSCPLWPGNLACAKSSLLLRIVLLYTIRVIKTFRIRVIKTFRHKGVERFFGTGSKAGIQPNHAERLRKQLFALDNAKSPKDMNAPG